MVLIRCSRAAAPWIGFDASRVLHDGRAADPTARLLNVGVGASLSAEFLHLLYHSRIDRRTAYMLSLCTGAFHAGGHALADEGALEVRKW